MLALILIIYVLLHISVRAYIGFDKKSLKLYVKYLWFTIYKMDTSLPPEKSSSEAVPTEAKDDKPDFELSELEEVDSTQDKPSQGKTLHEPKGESKEAEEKSSKEPDAEGKDKEEKEHKSLKERWEEIKPYFPVAKKAFRRLLKMIRLYDFELHLTVGGEDAAKAGMNFARANQVFYPALALLCTAFSVKIKKTEINCDYNANTFDVSGGVVIMVRPSAVIALAVYLGINYLKIKSRNRKNQKINNKRKKDKVNG